MCSSRWCGQHLLTPRRDEKWYVWAKYYAITKNLEFISNPKTPKKQIKLKVNPKKNPDF